MKKHGCSLSKQRKLATEEELKVVETELVDKAVKELAGFQSDPSNYKSGLVTAGGPPAVSAVLPPKVLKLILKRVSKSEDIHNVLLAFPELDKAFQSKKTLWLFGAVLPHLMTKYLVAEKFNDLARLRRVSKTWKASVNSSLRSHVALRQLPPQISKDSKDDCQRQMPSENHFSYHRLQDPKLGASIFRTGQQIDEFLKSMTNHSGNPFPGKYVDIAMSHSNLDEALALFEKFGKHVLFLEIEVKGDYHQCHFQLCENILKCLSQSPNLRSLTFTGAWIAHGDQQARWEIFSRPEADNLFPDLPNLEAFNWQITVKGYLIPQAMLWITGIIHKYGRKDGLLKLNIPPHLYDLVSSNLKSLTEINLVIQIQNEDSSVEDIFKKLPNPKNLRTLCLQHDWRRPRVVNGKKLIALLSGYKLETLNLEDVTLDHEDPYWCKKEVIAAVETKSIRSLCFTEELKTCYDFLKRLPNLQFLTIHFTVYPIVKWRYHFEVANDSSLANKIRGFVLKACDRYVKIMGNKGFSIWNEFPNLQMFSATVTKKSGIKGKKDPVWNMRFVRECGDKAFFYGNSPARNERVRVLIEDFDEEEDWSVHDGEDYNMDHSFHG